MTSNYVIKFTTSEFLTEFILNKINYGEVISKCGPSFLRSSITLELLSELLTLFEEIYLLGSLFVPVLVILMQFPIELLVELLDKSRSVKK